MNKTLAAMAALAASAPAEPIRKRYIKVPLLEPECDKIQKPDEVEAARAKAQAKRDMRAAKRAKAS